MLFSKRFLKLQDIERKCLSTVRELRSKSNQNTQDKKYFLLIIPAAAFGLGTWQVQRRQWKLNLIQKMNERILTEPISLPDDLSDLADKEYYRVIVRGTFDHSHELHIQPRSPVAAEASKIMGKRPEIGANVVTALQLSGRKEKILVNRGWVPKDKINPSTRPAGQVTGEVQFIGVVRSHEKRPPFGAKNNSAKNQWFHRDVHTMAELLNTEPVFIDADQRSTVPGGPIGGQTRVTVRNEHFSYILTWYSLAAITFVGWYRAFGRLK